LEETPTRRRSTAPWLGAGIVILIVVAGWIAWATHERQMAVRLLTTEATQIPAHSDLVRYSEGLAKPAYQRHCASCHGKDLQGDQARGAPNLKDPVWLYETGGVGDIERTVLYGIRSGNAKSRNITDMPALGRNQQISPAEARDVATFVLALTHRQADTAAVERGSAIFQGKGVCYDCHSADASGNPDYGAPALNDAEWLYGGDAKTLYDSIYSGRHGVCPAWIDKLRPEVIRALAVWLHQVSHPPRTRAEASGVPAHG
jgi:cytochrome c oxidase cbb3-type subunit 3